MLSAERTIRPGCFAVKVRAQAEATISGTLRRKGYEVLLPTYTHRQQYTDRIKQSSRALFPGYVFVRLDPQHLLGVIATEGVSYVVKSGNTLLPLPAADEHLLQSLSSLSDVCQPCDFPRVGQRVMIQSGPLAQQRGTLVRIDNRDRLVLSLESICGSVTLDLRDVAVQVCEA